MSVRHTLRETQKIYGDTCISTYREQIVNEGELEIVVEFYDIVWQNVLQTTEQCYV